MCAWVPYNIFIACPDDISQQTCTNLCHSTVPIVSLSSDMLTVEEGESAEIVIIRSGDPGIAVTVMLEAVEVIGAQNQAQCTF